MRSAGDGVTLGAALMPGGGYNGLIPRGGIVLGTRPCQTGDFSANEF